MVLLIVSIRQDKDASCCNYIIQKSRTNQTLTRMQCYLKLSLYMDYKHLYNNFDIDMQADYFRGYMGPIFSLEIRLASFVNAWFSFKEISLQPF